MAQKKDSENVYPINPPEEEKPPTEEAAGDIFDNLENLRLKQDYNKVKVRRPFTLCPIRKPRRHEWFQARADYTFETMLFEYKEDMSPEWYLPVGRDVVTELEGQSLHAVTIFLWVNRKSQCCIWPVRLADDDGRVNSWHESMREVFRTHANSGEWIRIEGGDGGYLVEVAESQALPEPEWPALPLKDILRVAFKGGRVIDSLEHQIIQRLRGRI